MRKFKETLFWKVIKNKYFITFFIFALIYFFLDENNFFVRRSLRKEVKELTYAMDTMREGAVKDSLKSVRLKYDLDSIERYGREQYFMKRKNEDVFVVSRSEK